MRGMQNAAGAGQLRDGIDAAPSLIVCRVGEVENTYPGRWEGGRLALTIPMMMVFLLLCVPAAMALSG